VSRFELEQEISAPLDAVFAALTDATRLPRWLPNTEAIEEVSGPLTSAGTTFIQRGAPGIRRPGGTVASDPPRLWQVRMTGFGERVDATFRLEPGGEDVTRLRLSADVRNGPAFLAPLLDRAVSRLDQRVWRKALMNLRAELERPPAQLQVGAVYSLDSGAGIFRVGQLLDLDDGHVHVRLYQQRFGRRPSRTDLAPLGLGRPNHYADIQPLRPGVKAVVAGSPTVPWLLLDGGFGLPHVPLTRRAFDDAAPVELFKAGVTVALMEPIAAWHGRNGGAFGETPSPGVGAYVSVVLQGFGFGFGIVKLLRWEAQGVHVRVFSNSLEERPTTMSEASLESRPLDLAAATAGRPPSEPIAIGHLPLTHASFAGWQPEFLSMTLVDPEELRGYEEWVEAGQGRFT